MRRSRFARAIAVAFTAGSLMAELPSSAGELADLLKKPISPASIALLAPFSRDPAVIARWKQALGDRNPDVRAVAARAINTCSSVSLLPDVEGALALETDSEAAREEIRTLCLIGDARQRDLAIDAGVKRGCAVDADLIRSLARALGPAAFPLYFQRLHTLCLSDSDRFAFFLLAAVGDPESLTGAASMALGRHDDDAWRAILEAAKKETQLAASPVLRAALASPDSSMRGEAAWYLAGRYCQSLPGSVPDVLEALRAGESADQQPVLDPELAFGGEILRRVLGEPAVESKDWIACLKTNEKCHLDADFERSPLYKYLTVGEREAIEERNHKNLPPELKTLAASDAASPALSSERGDMWAVDSLPRGLGEDLLRIASCGGSWRGGIGIANVAFGRDGRPREVSLVNQRMSTGCEEILKAVFLLSLAPANLPTTQSKPLTLETVLLPEVLACAGPWTSGTTQLRSRASIYRVRGRIEPPKLTRRVEPIYPVVARQKRLDGTTILEAIITSSGCVKGLTVLKSSSLILDAAAIAGVAQWRYQPAMLDGQPVSVYLTVTVKFRLG